MCACVSSYPREVAETLRCGLDSKQTARASKLIVLWCRTAQDLLGNGLACFGFCCPALEDTSPHLGCTSWSRAAPGITGGGSCWEGPFIPLLLIRPQLPMHYFLPQQMTSACFTYNCPRQGFGNFNTVHKVAETLLWGSSCFSSIMSVLQQLHWLICCQAQFKILGLIYKLVYGLWPG